MLLSRNARLALASIRSARWRSFLTMFGIIIGVASVVITVSIGEGVKQQVQKQSQQLGNDLVTIRPGTSVERNQNGEIVGVNYFSSANSGALSEQDLQNIQATPGVGMVSPFNVVSGVARYEDRTMPSGFIVGVDSNVPTLLNQKLEYGNFFDKDDKNKAVVVIGKRVAEQLFQELSPVGKSLQIRGKPFIVRGVLEEFPGSPLVTTADFNKAMFVPYEMSKELSNGQVQIYQVLAKSSDSSAANNVANEVRAKLRSTHGGEEDFTVLRQDENLAVVGTTLNLLTTLIATIAGLSLLVGGIGIMNIMLVLVSERTREIGLRKAIGATNRQIMSQFLTEAGVISLVGGIFGILLSILGNYLLRIFTDLKPVITWPIMFISVGVALIVGVVFGTAPAIRAARKDPIESLRYQ